MTNLVKAASAHSYTPLIIRVVSNPYVSRFDHLVLATSAFCLLLYTAGDLTLSSTLGIAISIVITGFLWQRQQQHLTSMRGILSVTDQQFEQLQTDLSYYKSKYFLRVSLCVPALFTLGNWANPRFQQLIAFEHVDVDLMITALLTMLTWLLYLQCLTYLVSRSFYFKSIASKHLSVDLLQISKLVPFGRVGLTSFLVFSTSYALAPIIYLHDQETLNALIIMIALSLPLALFSLIKPMLAVRSKIITAKKQEIDAVNKALHGDLDALESTLLAGDTNLSRVDMLRYRDWISKVSNWPLNDSILSWLFSFAVLPFVSWAAVFAIELIIARTV